MKTQPIFSSLQPQSLAGLGPLWHVGEANRHAEIIALLTEILDLLRKQKPEKKRRTTNLKSGVWR